MATYQEEETGAIVNASDDYMSEDKLQGIVGSELDDAEDYIDNYISPSRALATKYYNGEPYGDEEEGRSQVVSMDVRDTVQAVMPSLLRIFTGSERAVEFMPRHAEDVASAKQATDYVNYVFNQDNKGFLALHDAFKDALIRKVGIIKFVWDESVEVSASELTGLDDNALAALYSDDSVTIQAIRSTSAEMSVEQAMAIEAAGLQPPMLHDVEITRMVMDGKIRVEAVPPEEFLIDRRAKNIDDATMVAHRRILTVSDLVAMGYDKEQVKRLASNSDELDWNPERYARNPARTDDYHTSSDPSQRLVSYAEVYIKVDRDGDGIAELRKVCVAGSGHEILADNPCDMRPFASFCPDPEAHEFFGTSMADIVMDIQRIKSVVMRNTLDSLAMSIHPRIAVTEGQVSIEDVMNTETGAIIRQRSPGQVQPISMPFVGQQAFPVLQYLDSTKESRTGISRAANGLDANALQSSTATAVAATVSAAQQQIEMIARIFAETGMRDLMRGLLKLVCQHQQRKRIVRLNNDYVPIDPRYWDSTMDVSINVALGRGSDTERMMMLRQIGEMQKEAMSTMGAQNPLTSMDKLYNTLAEMTQLAGFKDVSKFWSDPVNFRPSPQQDEPDINEQLIGVQIQQIEADIQKKAAELALKREQMQMEDDLKRDQMEMDLYVTAEELRAKYGTQLRVEDIKKSTAISRESMKAQSELIKEAVRDEQI